MNSMVMLPSPARIAAIHHETGERRQGLFRTCEIALRWASAEQAEKEGVMLRFRASVAACGAALACLLAFATTAAAQSEVKSVTLDAVKKRGQLICGVDTGIPGYAFQDSKGEWQGLDIAYCRAL